MASRHVGALALGFVLAASGCNLVVGSSGIDTDAGSGPVACGTQTCTGGSVCCNASCGICTAPDTFCIQIACDPTTVGGTCRDLTCGSDRMCMDTPSGPQCVPVREDPCAASSCPNGCEVVRGAAVCNAEHSDAAAPPPAKDAGAPVTRFDAGRGGSADATAEANDAETAGDAGETEPDTGNAQDSGPPPQHDAGAADAGPEDAGTVEPPPDTCAVTSCPDGTYCDDVGDHAHCIENPTCKGVSCGAFQHCELVQVQCVRAPCPPVPICVDDPADDPCATIVCKANTHCEVTATLCDAKPQCTPVAQCVGDKGTIPCGGNQCGPGSYCCNASCGTCAPKNGACTQQICDAQR